MSVAKIDCPICGCVITVILTEGYEQTGLYVAAMEKRLLETETKLKNITEGVSKILGIEDDD